MQRRDFLKAVALAPAVKELLPALDTPATLGGFTLAELETAYVTAWSGVPLTNLFWARQLTVDTWHHVAGDCPVCQKMGWTGLFGDIDRLEQGSPF